MAEAENDDDLSLVRAYLDGDAGAFDRVFTRYHQRIRALCVRYVGDGQAAEDLVQETFYNVLRALNRVDDSYNFSAWVHRIAINLCHDELRRRAKMQQHIEPGGDDVEDAVLRLMDRDRQGHPEDALEMAQLRRLVWDVARNLPDRHRMVLTLRELQGLSYASIAHVMGISQSAVETLLHRARRRFREEYLRMIETPEGIDECTTMSAMVASTRRRRLSTSERAALVGHLETCVTCRRRHLPEDLTAAAEAAAT